ncbi:S41 family peptidase [Pedobacter cryoconitis]|uniref:Tricorn protease-like protein n=1 Tax=Pedobacter cryoconitis TaxID=188932 RepID=A0A327SHW2_9SPHI|nr:S41 family peptidase [Pedobacter cryoconitis]RAJ28308.1 tricorn protease-like protein [Pedobacter cryoconitis]
MTNFYFTFFLLLIALSTNAQQHPVRLLKNTSWVQQGYGRYLKIEDSTYTYYNANSLSCKALAEGKLDGRFSVVSLDNNKMVLNPGGIVDYIFTRVDTLPPKCTHMDTTAASYEENFKVFWETFNDNYAFFRERNVNWKQVYQEYLPRAQKIDSPKEFSNMLLKIVKKIGDGHIRLEIPDSLKAKAVVAAPAIKRKKDDIIKAIQERYLVNTHAYNNGVISWGKVKGTRTGYILIKDMNGFAKKQDKGKDFRSPLVEFEEELNGVDQVMEKILADIGKSDAMVIDLRFNGGGLETVALRLLSYFVSGRKHVLSVAAKTPQGNTAKQACILQPANNAYQGKVQLLLSGNTASAAEIFALAALSYPEIKITGSRTAGIFSEILWKELPIGWEFSLSNEIYTDPAGKTYEGTGIPVSQDMNYSGNRLDFYNSFYSGDRFTDVAMDQLHQKKASE